MSEDFVEQLKACNDYAAAEMLVDEFEQAPRDVKKKAEPKLIKLLSNGRADEFVRSRAAELLGVSKTETARKSLLERLHTEKSGLARGRIALALARSFNGDDLVEAIVEQFEKERSVVTRRIMSRALIESKGNTAVPTLLKLINEPDPKIRNEVIRGLGERKEAEAVDFLIERLEIDDPHNITRSILDALANINDAKAVNVFIRYLQKPNLPVETYLTLVQGLGRIESRDEKITTALLEAICHEDIIVSIAATDTLLDLYDRKDAALRIARYGVEHAQPDQQRRIADALRIISDKGAIKFLQSMQSDVDPASGNRAQMLLEQIGGQYAVDALVKHRLDVLQKAGSRVEKFDEQALAIFQDTIEQARRGFSLSLNMSLGIFITGVFLIIVSAINLSFGNDALATWITGGAGLASMVATFYREPLLRVQNAVANLVQTEIVFLGYIRQVTQISAMFEREYLNNEKFDVAALRKLLGFTERTMKETMPLVQTYTAVSVPLLEVEEAEEDQS